MTPTGPRKKTCIQIIPWLKAELSTLADADDRSLSAYIERVLEDHVRRILQRKGRPLPPEEAEHSTPLDDEQPAATLLDRHCDLDALVEVLDD